MVHDPGLAMPRIALGRGCASEFCSTGEAQDRFSRRSMARISNRGTAVSIGLLLGLLAGCAPSDREVEYEARKALLQRQNKGIRELIEEEQRGSLVSNDRFLIGLDEKVVERLFRSQL